MLLSDKPKDICVLRLSAIGDVCHAVAVVQAIQRHYPESKITWVIGKVEAALLKDLPGVNFVIFDKSKGRSAYQEIKRVFKGTTFDVLLHMQVALRANLVARCISAKVKIGFDWQRAREGHSLFVNKRIEKQNEAHVIEGFMGFAHAIGVPRFKPKWQMPVTDADKAFANEQLSKLGKPLVIAPAASGAERNWVASRYVEVAQYAHSKGFSIILTGGPSKLERDLALEIMTLADFPILDLVAKTSLKELLSVLEKASLVIAPDTGPAHMAVCMGTPVIGLYAHSNPARTGPYLYQDYVVEVYHQNIKQQYGKSAQQLPWGRRNKGHNLMKQITTESAIKMFDRVVREQNLL